MRIAIVGGGFSGTAVAINILRRSVDEILLILFERGETIGEGAAYGTKRREHVLNVPAAKMSGLPDDPDHLLKWLREHGPEVDLESKYVAPKAYIPREVYSLYLKSTLKEEIAKAKGVDFQRVSDEAVAARMLDNEAVEVTLASGRQVEADRLVLCLGNERSIWPCASEEAPQDKLIGNPWAIDPSKIPEEASVLIVGTGLSMADVVVSLAKHNHRGRVTAISRRGIIPKPHNPDLAAAKFHFEDKPRTAMELSCEVMEKIAHHTSLGGDWREAFDGLRSATPKLWQSLAPAERQIAVRKGKAVWDAHRHRVAPEIHEALQQYFMGGNGNARVQSAHLVGLRSAPGGAVLAKLDVGKGEEPREEEFDFVVNCTGPNNSVTKSSNKLMQSLLEEGLVLPGESGLGIRVSPSSRVIGKEGESPSIWAVGPQLMDRDFESIAVPELREQALHAAKSVLAQ